ncbi:MAG TPA: Dyp-type peroxidase [Polyangiaceae bacterium]|nr:Dyp-type peroxidase [Polyangiaceae bacterium]
MAALDRRDIQGNIVRGYRLPFAAHVFLAIGTPERARHFLREIRFTSDEKQIDGLTRAINVAFTFAGLAKLRNCADLESRFVAFSEGMPRRAKLLGDDPNAYPNFWQKSDLWLSIYGRSQHAVDRELRDVLRNAGTDLELLSVERAAAIVKSEGERQPWFEHFGFRDGVSNPVLEHADDRDPAGPGTGRVGPNGSWLPIRTGEFLFGYENDAGDPIPDGELGALLTNGTFVAIRKLEQHVRAFRAYLADASLRYGVPADELAEKIVGRRRDGTPLVAGSLNDFDYAKDRIGHGCPLGSHVRRVHPRDVTDVAGTSGRHRLIRRGMPYGTAPADATAPHGKSDSEDCGLFFIGLNASIEEQFEFIQRFWINASSRSAIANDWDPLAGAHGTTGKLVVPREGLPLLLSDVPRFVHSKGGQYFFMPGLAALRSLCG